MSYKVEKTFEYLGYKCVVVFNSLGHRCGYVGVPIGHKLYGKNYRNKTKLGNREEYIDLIFDVHGGLTYAGGGKNSEYPIKSDLWWFGFDCGHYGDRNDYEYAMKLFPDDKKRYKVCMQIERDVYGDVDKRDEIIRSENYVAGECRFLAKQLKEYEENAK